MRKLKPLIVAVCLASFPVKSVGAQTNQPTDTRAETSSTARASPLVLAFYYTWYGTPWGVAGHWRHWPEGGHRPENRDARGWRDLGAAQHPIDGPYDSLSPEVIAAHARQAREVGIDGWVSTWWAQGDSHDAAFRLLLEVLQERQPRMRATVYYETTGGSEERAVNDLLYILETYGSHPNFLKMNSRPLLFIYGRAMKELSPAAWLRVSSRVRAKYPCTLSADSEDRELIRAFGSGHGYNPVNVILGGQDIAAYYAEFRKRCHDVSSLAALTVLPGYDDRQVRRPGLFLERRGGATYRDLWWKARIAHPDVLLITSFNEWHEGSEIEPSREHGTYFLRETGLQSAYFKAGTGGLQHRASAETTRAMIKTPAGGDLWLDRESTPARDVLVNMAGQPVKLVISNLRGVLVSDGRGFASSGRGSITRAVARALEPGVTKTIYLAEDEELHFWKEKALATFLRSGGYHGAREFRRGLESGYRLGLRSQFLPEDGRGRELRAISGTLSPLRASFESLGSNASSVARLSIEGDSRIRIDGDDLLVTRDTPGGLYSLRLLAHDPEGRRPDMETSIAIEVIDAFRLDVAATQMKLELVATPQLPFQVEGDLVFSVAPVGESALFRRKVQMTGPTEVLSTSFSEPKFYDLCSTLPTATTMVARLSWTGGAVGRLFLIDAEIRFDRESWNDGIRHVGDRGAGDGNTVAVQAGERIARVSGNSEGKPSYFYFDVDEKFLSGSPVALEVEYLDQGAEWFELHYDSSDESLPLAGAYKSSKRIPVGSTRVWKTQTFVLDDAHFRGRQNFKADFRLHSAGPLSVYRVFVAHGRPSRK